nr:tripartite tricarboxylate transporter substrate binding protein [uncultured Roseococcus sp.]
MSAIPRRSFLALASGACATPALAQGVWNPARPVTIVVGFPQGGRTDIACRLLLPGLQAALGVPVEIDNRAGEAGNLGTEAVMSAKPDGYTLLLGSVGPMTINPHTVEGMTLDPRELAPVGLAGRSSLVLCADPALGLRDLAGLKAYLAGRREPLAYGSPGAGSLAHLAMEMLRQQLGRPAMAHTPSRGSAAALQDLLGGRTKLLFDNASAVIPALRRAKASGLLTTGLARCPALTEIATAQEQGLPDLAFYAWIGLFAPRRTAAPMIVRLNAALNAAVAEAGLRAHLTGRGDEPGGGTPEELARLMTVDYDRWGGLARASSIRTDA